jgi:deferrochelatase/peroxidase EfeB
MMDKRKTAPGHLTRRELIAGGVSLGVGIGVGHAVSTAAPHRAQAESFHGPHQAGIATAAQEFLYIAALDLTTSSTEDLANLLRAWTVAAEQLTSGGPSREAHYGLEGPVDPGEALGLQASQLTLTFGFGPRLFEQSSGLGLAALRPRHLQPLPAFDGDQLELSSSDGDLCIQACANEPQVTFHAVHVLTRLADETATIRWTQSGFGRTASTSRDQPTQRNLMGFKDGTNNIRAEDDEALKKHVWVDDPRESSWTQNGTYMITRRIRILFDVWDTTTLAGQQRAVGRYKASGAPLGSTDEYDPVDLTLSHSGETVIPGDAHIRVASPSLNDGHRILRRGYSYVEGSEPKSGQLEAGLFFICFQNDPISQFVSLQHKLAGEDALSRHTEHTASAIFFCPPGTSRGAFIGSGLLA